MIKTYPELPGWMFELDEISAGVYEVIGRDKDGRIVQSKGIDLDALVERCKKDAADILMGI